MTGHGQRAFEGGERPLAVDLCSGLGGWAEGLEVEGWDVIRVDIADMFAETGTPKPPNCLLMLQDIRTFHGSQAKGCDLIVASPPCQAYSWMAMPWSRAKQVARAIRGEDEFPPGYRGSRTIEQLNELFNACFRIQREASAAKGEHVPMVVENVKGAQPWVGQARWSFGSYYLWGDVPALMPPTVDARKLPGFRFDGSGASFQTASVNEYMKNGVGGSWFGHGPRGAPGEKNNARDMIVADIGGPRHAAEGIKQGGSWFHDNKSASRMHSSKSPARKAASAKIAKIPLPLAQHIARCWKPIPEAA